MAQVVRSLSSVTLVLGGARSGKSRHAERLVARASDDRVYIATAEPRDSEMAARIAEHRRRRGTGWSTVEEPLDLTGALRTHARSGCAVLVDCLTLWLSNLLEHDRDIAGAQADLVRTLPELDAPVVLVSNEVGLGITPDNALARAFMDHAGRLHAAVAEVADQVHFMAAGLPLVLKPSTHDWSDV